MQTTKRILSSILAVAFMSTVSMPKISADNSVVESGLSLGGSDGVTGDEDSVSVEVLTIDEKLSEPIIRDGDFSAKLDELIPVIMAANTSAEDHATLQTAVSAAPANGTEYVIEIADDIVLNSAITIATGKNIVIRSADGHTYTLTQNITGRHFSVSGALTLEDIILDGSTGGTDVTAAAGGVQLNTSGTFTMNNGAVVQNCFYSASGGGVLMSGGKFTMNGGVVKGNTASSGGGGVLMNSTSCTFIMNGGVITDNTANGSTNAGSGVFARGNFYMYGGEISNNVATASGASGGGVLVYENGNFVMGNPSGSGAGYPVIKGNTTPRFGGGVYVNSGKFTMYNSEITNNTPGYGGGVYVSSGCSFLLDGGSVGNNTASSYGGGVCTAAASSATFTMENGSVSGNKLVTSGSNVYGGGVYVGANSSFIMAGGEINGNTVTAGSYLYGGAVYIGASGSFEMLNGTISGNRSTSTGYTYGGGVYVGDNGRFTMADGVIGSNTVTGYNIYGGGVLVGNLASFTMNGGKITGNILTCGNASQGGGVCAVRNGRFTMTDGEISSNKSTSSGNNSYGGGVYVDGGAYDGTSTTLGTGTFLMTGGNIFDNEAITSYPSAQSGAGGAMIRYGSFTMRGDSVISGNKAAGGNSSIGGGVAVSVDATFTMESGLIGGYAAGYANTSALKGGGVYLTGSDGKFVMTGGAVSGNTSVNGGGVYLDSGTGGKFSAFTMNNCTVNGNTAVSGNGGGVYINGASSIVTVQSGAVRDNAGLNGGGAYVNGGTLTINGDTGIGGNTATAGNGGGAYVTASGKLIVTGANGVCAISDNSAPNGNGGGIHTMDASYGNITTADNTRFGGNTASAAYLPPANAQSYTNIRFASVSITDHPLNNYDINYYTSGATPIYLLIYDANGGNGTPPDSEICPSGDTITVADQNTLSMSGYSFAGWNTYPDGSGATYIPGDAITLYGSVLLYAQWSRTVCTVLYNANGARGTPPDSDACLSGETVTIAGRNTLSVSGYSFVGWNTDADGGGTTYNPGDALTLYGSIILYAQWNRNNGGSEINRYTLTYDANGGTGSYVTPGISSGEAYKILSPSDIGIIRDNYTFAGWNSLANGVGIFHDPGDVITLYDDMTLYAQWSINGTPPGPSIPGHTIIPGHNGTFMQINEHGVPIGTWTLNDENIWIYEELQPLSGNPLTGRSNSKVLAIAAMSLILSGFHLRRCGKKCPK